MSFQDTIREGGATPTQATYDRASTGLPGPGSVARTRAWAQRVAVNPPVSAAERQRRAELARLAAQVIVRRSPPEPKRTRASRPGRGPYKARRAQASAEFAAVPPAALAALSPRLQRIVELRKAGASLLEIAAAFGLRPHSGSLAWDMRRLRRQLGRVP